MSYGAKTITTSATLIIDGNCMRKGFFLLNNSTKTVFIGPDSSITTANAMPLLQYQHLSKDKVPEGWLGPIYGIVASGTSDVRYWEFAT